MKGSSLKHILFCPGPVNLADNVKLATIRNEIGHREEEFSDLLKEIQKKLLLISGASRRKYHAVVVTGSGTAANETVLSSIVGEKNILVISNGEFGERLYQISALHNKNTHHLQFKWAEKMDLKAIKSYLSENKIDIVAMVHHETSTGMLNPIDRISKVVKAKKALFVVDMVSSFGADPVSIEKTDIDFVTSSASKALGSLPGVSFVIGKKTEFEKLKHIQARTMYLNLYKFYQYSKEHDQTPNTPAVQTFFALNRALSNMVEEGIVKRYRMVNKLAKVIRKELRAMNLNTLINEKDMSSCLTTFLLPENINIDHLRGKLRENNIIIYNGKGPFLNKVFQVANIGNLNENDTAYFLKAMEAALIELGHFRPAHINIKNLITPINPILTQLEPATVH